MSKYDQMLKEDVGELLHNIAKMWKDNYTKAEVLDELRSVIDTDDSPEVEDE